jgi:hypothetical protein
MTNILPVMLTTHCRSHRGSVRCRRWSCRPASTGRIGSWNFSRPTSEIRTPEPPTFGTCARFSGGANGARFVRCRRSARIMWRDTLSDWAPPMRPPRSSSIWPRWSLSPFPSDRGVFVSHCRSHLSPCRSDTLGRRPQDPLQVPRGIRRRRCHTGESLPQHLPRQSRIFDGAKMRRG